MPIFMNYTPSNGVQSGEIELLSFSHAAQNLGNSLSGTPTRVLFNEITVTKTQDASSPVFMRGAAVGELLPAVQFTFSSAAAGVEAPYLSYKLTEVIVTGYSMSSGGDRPTESISFDYSKIEITYIMGDLKGGNTVLEFETLGKVFIPPLP